MASSRRVTTDNIAAGSGLCAAFAICFFCIGLPLFIWGIVWMVTSAEHNVIWICGLIIVLLTVIGIIAGVVLVILVCCGLTNKNLVGSTRNRTTLRQTVRYNTSRDSAVIYPGSTDQGRYPAYPQQHQVWTTAMEPPPYSAVFEAPPAYESIINSEFPETQAEPPNARTN